MDTRSCADNTLLGRRAGSRTSPRNSGHSNQTTGNSNEWTKSLSSTSRTSATSLGPPSSYNDRTSDGTPTSSSNRGPGFSFLNLSREPSISETASLTSNSGSYTYWCTVCEHCRAFQTCDGWKRHMKEHETSYICMPYGPMEPTEIGPKCVFCGTPDPNEDHLATHNHALCVGKLITARSYSRRSHLLKHLRNHGTHSPGALADKWRCTLLNKRFFSCGFCVSLFTAHSGLLNHLDLVHFRHSQDVSEWDCNKVIKGLLLSAEVEKHWRRIMSFYPLADSARITWDLSVVKDLQMRLEICEEAAEVLAQAAFNKSVCGWPQSISADSCAASSSTDQQMDTGLNLLEYQHKVATSQLPSADSTHLVTGSTGFPTSNMAYGQASDIPWTALDGGNRLNSSLAVSGVPQDQAQFFEQANAMDLGQDNHGTQIPYYLRNTNKHCGRYNHEYVPSGLHPRNMPTQIDSSTFRSWQASTTNTGLYHQLNFSTINGNHHTSRIERSHNTGSTGAIATSDNGPAPTQSIGTSPPTRGKSPSIVAHLKRSFSRGKLREPAPEPPEPMDIDLDNLMRHMQDEEHTRSERRNDRFPSHGI